MGKNGVLLRYTKAASGGVTAEYLDDNGMWLRVPDCPPSANEVDSKRFNRMMARNGRDALIVTCVLSVVIVGGLAWYAFQQLTEYVATLHTNHAPVAMVAAGEQGLTFFVVFIVACVILTIACVAIMFESNNRYWGV